MENEEIRKIRSGRNVVFTFFACLMTAIIVFLASNLGQNLYDGMNPNHSKGVRKCEKIAKISDNDLLTLYDILGIKKVDNSTGGLVTYLPTLDKNLENLTIEEKKTIVYYYAYDNGLLFDEVDPVSKQRYKGITIDDFNKIKEYYGIKEDYTMFFSSAMIKQNELLYEETMLGSLPVIQHNLSSTIENDEVIIKDNLLIESTAEGTKENKTIKYTFKKNKNEKYYLAIVEIEK